MGVLNDITSAQTAIQARKIARRMPQQGGSPDVLDEILRELRTLNQQIAWQNQFLAAKATP